ncbi:MAG: hypothetical protein IJM30_09315 [Thermoguttaceae bacterium]|nr:hypothetical protein [Thermoguttaceae bacterium]
MTEEQIIEAFRAMWDFFPEPVMLIKKNREIIALNRKCAESGMKPGERCSSYGSPQQHKGCRCNEAVDEKKAVAVTYPSPFGKAFGYWIPVATKPEWIIHFGVGANFEYESASVGATNVEDNLR